MKNKLLLLGAVATAVVLFIKNKAKAFELSTIKLEAFKINGFNGTQFNTTLTVSIQNPTAIPLAFNGITGKVYEKDKLLSVFSRDIKTAIPANATTKFDIQVDISVANLVASALDLIANGINTSFTIDSVTDVSGVKIPVRQVFNINFAKATNETIESNRTDTPGTVDSGTVDVPGAVINETPTLVAPQVINPNIDTPVVLVSNYNGQIDPTGGAVITLPPPDTLLAAAVSTPFVALDSSIYLNPAYSGVLTMNI